MEKNQLSNRVKLWSPTKNYRITEQKELENTIKIIQCHHQPILIMPTDPHPPAQHLHVS